MQQSHAFVGTWILHPRRSKLELGPGVSVGEKQTMVIAEKGAELHVNITAIRHGGPSYVIPGAGGEGRVIEGPCESLSGKQISDRIRESKFFKGGKPLLTIRSEVSAAGKTLTATVHGNHPESGQLLHRMHDDDRVILVGDTRQHEAVEAGRPYQQL